MLEQIIEQYKILEIGTPIVLFLLNLGIGYLKTGKLDADSLLGIFAFFKNDFKKEKLRYEDQIIDKDQDAPFIIDPSLVEEPSPITKFLENSPTRKILDLRWNDQRDNQYSPKSACNVTALQVAIGDSVTDDQLWLKANSDEIRDWIRSKYPKDWTSWIKTFFDQKRANEVLVVMLRVAHSIIGESYAKIDWRLNFQTLESEIDLGYPVVCLANTVGKGHFITVVGYDKDKDVFVCHDAWGNWNMNYRGENGLDGSFVEYPKAKLKSVWRSQGFIIHSDKRLIV